MTSCATVPGADWTLLSQGAEARVWKIPHYSHIDSDSKEKSKVTESTGKQAVASSPAVCKERFPKAYRHPVLDERLTKQRCRMEARLLEKCRTKGNLDVPTVFHAEYGTGTDSLTRASAILYLEFIEGKTVRDFLEEDVLPHYDDDPKVTNPNAELAHIKSKREHKTLHQVAHNIGLTVAKLHEVGIVHGDLTTSNMMIRSEHQQTDNPIGLSQERKSVSKPNMITLIDFGLAKNSTAPEERAVDLYVLERALISTHPTLPDSFLVAMFSAYSMDNDTSNASGTSKEAEQPEAAIHSTSKDSSTGKKGQASFQSSKHDTLTRLEKVRQRGRKRECFG